MLKFFKLNSFIFLSKKYFSSNLNVKYKELGLSLLSGNRSSLSRIITLIESSLYEHQIQADLLLNYLSNEIKNNKDNNNIIKRKGFQNNMTLRLGIAGPPGGGKSTLIEMIGIEFIKQGYRVAVVPVDPSSPRSGGSILGDKTRMEELSKSPNAYVRPSPTRGILGGIAEHTTDVVELCEYAGYDIVIVESVGLGQSEVELDEAVDMFVLLVSPGGGDDLQASKKGIMESVDLLVISKADGELLSTARHTKSDYSITLNLIRPKINSWTPRVQLISSITKLGLEEFIKNVKDFHNIVSTNGELSKKRQKQKLHWLLQNFKYLILTEMDSNSNVKSMLQNIKDNVINGNISPRTGARNLLKVFESSSNSSELISDNQEKK